MEIYYDSLQEGTWFKSLHPSLKNATLVAINDITSKMSVARVLTYDRPDIILADKGEPILVIERTIEVPTGHNVGQRFARLAAAAEAQIPLVYFGPYMARKHGGKTAGPRYMNLRLFYSLDVLAAIHDTPVTTINWPVDAKCELLRSGKKDAEMKEYLNLFFSIYVKSGLKGVRHGIFKSNFHAARTKEREDFIQKYVRAPKEYDLPPPSVEILPAKNFAKSLKDLGKYLKGVDEVVVYKVGMTYVRSDPYTGTGMLYRYLYVLGEKKVKRVLILNFPSITMKMWEEACKSGNRKDVRLFRHISNIIMFSDGYFAVQPS